VSSVQRGSHELGLYGKNIDYIQTDANINVSLLSLVFVFCQFIRLTSHFARWAGHYISSPIRAFHPPGPLFPVPVCMIVNPLAPTHSRLRIPSSRLCLNVYLSRAHCPGPSLDGHYLHAYFKPGPIPRPPHTTLLHILSGFQHQCLSGPGLQHCHRSGRPRPTHLAPVRQVPWHPKNANFLAIYPRPLSKLFSTQTISVVP